MDWSPIYSFDDSNIKKYFDYLQSSQAHFQSVIVSHNPRPNLDWSGWAIAKLTKTVNGIQVIQNEK